MEVSAMTGKGIEGLVECIVESVEKFKSKSDKDTWESEGDISLLGTESKHLGRVEKKRGCCAV
jgi:translation initiation factor IF-2